MERSKAVLGTEHPATTGAAWNLFMALHKMGERDVAQAIIEKHLLWLLADGTELHSGGQRQIREILGQAVATMNQAD